MPTIPVDLWSKADLNYVFLCSSVALILLFIDKPHLEATDRTREAAYAKAGGLVYAAFAVLLLVIRQLGG